MNFKNIHIGNLIRQKVTEDKTDPTRICKFLKCSQAEVSAMYESENIDTASLLQWSKLLGYDFFRIYSQHIMFYSSSTKENKVNSKQKSSLPEFRKNIYTKEIIEFILELIKRGEMTKQQIIEKYRIPKTTLYKWTSKYNSE